MNRRKHAVSLLQASLDAPKLSELMALSDESCARLACVAPLMPSALRQSIKAGPIDGDSWCLLVNNSATAAKLRQLLPALQAHLRTHGRQVNAIRIKLQVPQ